MRKSKNIAIIINSIQGGGAERVASILSKYLQNKGYKVYFFVETYNKKNAYTAAGKIITLQSARTPRGILPLALYDMIKVLKRAAEVKKLKKQYKIDTAISFMEDSNFINILSRGKEKIILRSCTIMSARDELKNTIYYNKLLISWLYKKADKIVVMTKCAKKDLANAWGVQSEKICIITNPLETNQQDENMDKERSWEFGNHAAISVGRMDQVKQQWHMLRAFKGVAERIEDAQLLLLGKGVNYQYLKKLAVSLGLENRVRFLGFQKDVSYFLQKSRVFLLTSKTEGFPNSMLEGMDAGTCVISVDCIGAPREILAPDTEYNGTLREIEYAQNGILVPALDGRKRNSSEALTMEEEILSQAIYSAMVSDEIIEKYRKAGKEKVKDYSVDDIGAIWEKII